MSHIEIDNDFFRTPEYIEFFRSARGAIYYFIRSSVIRESDAVKNFSNGGYYIYNTHFLKGELVGRYSQVDMAIHLKTSQPRISTYIKKLEAERYIKKIERLTKKGKILYYQVGIWEGKYGTPSYKETIWLDEIFRAYTKIAKQKRGEGRLAEFPSLKEMVYLLNEGHPEYEKLMTEWSKNQGTFIP